MYIKVMPSMLQTLFQTRNMSTYFRTGSSVPCSKLILHKVCDKTGRLKPRPHWRQLSPGTIVARVDEPLGPTPQDSSLANLSSLDVPPKPIGARSAYLSVDTRSY